MSSKRFVLEGKNSEVSIKNLKVTCPYTLDVEDDFVAFKEKWKGEIDVDAIDAPDETHEPFKLTVYNVGCVDKKDISRVLLEFEGEFGVWKISLSGTFGHEEIYIPKMAQAKEIYQYLIGWKWPSSIKKEQK